MDDADLRSRRQLLADPLRQRLAATWAQTEFVVDITEATARPGAPICLRWTDGPPSDQVSARLRPTWEATVTAEEPVPGVAHAYPVQLDRSYSTLSWCAAILVLHDAGTLAAAVDSGRRSCQDLLGRWVAGRALPAGLPHPLRVRAELLAEIWEKDPCGPDASAWAAWLVGDGVHILTQVLPGALDETSH